MPTIMKWYGMDITKNHNCNLCGEHISLTVETSETKILKEKMGNLADLISMIPGAGSKFKVSDFDEIKMKKYKAIIQSMTNEERVNPAIINGSRKNRISKGSGRSIVEVNRLLKQFTDMQKMLKGVQQLSKNPKLMRRR